MRVGVATTVLALLLAAVASSSLELVLVQLAHRHGARSGLPPANGSLICPRGCGLLNYNGKDMLLKQGEYLQGRYNGSRSELSANPFFATEMYPSGTTYDVRVVHSRSTDLTRTLQSAAALLKGLFPNSTEYVPGIHTVSFWSDQLLLINAVPSFQIYSLLRADQNNERIAAYAKTLFPSGVVEAMSVELQLEGFCAVPENFGQCVLGLQDTAATRLGEGVLPQFNVTFQYYEQLNDCRRTYNSWYYPYNASSPVDVARGSVGQNIAQRLLSNMRAAMLPPGTPGRLEKKLMHYSAHDTTVMPLVATLGNEGLMLPLFGQLYLWDLLNDTTTGTFHVRAAQSVPGQDPSSGHTITESVLPLFCMAGDGSVYNVTDLLGTCPFDDFERFINATLPTSPMGLCYVDPDTIHQIECDVIGAPGPLPNSTCYLFRQWCPQYACPHGSVVSPMDLSCIATSVPTIPSTTASPGANGGGDDSVSTGVVAGATVAAAVVGVFIGLLGVKLYNDRCADGKQTPLAKYAKLQRD